MTKKSLNYYGYDRSTYTSCNELIRSTNRRHMEFVNVWFLLLNAMFVIFSLLNIFGVDKRSLHFYLTYLILAAVFEVALHVLKKTVLRLSRLFVLINIVILVSFGIYASTAQPYMAALMFHVLIVLIGISYIDTMVLMTLALGVSCVIFLFTSFRLKSLSIAYQDLYNTIVFLSLALTLHYTFQRTRMDQFETYQKNVQIQRELEVKSSFDALTSLLNRGRFFSLAGEVLHAPHDEYMAVCLLDLDSFKQINDKLGHQMGDKAIQIAGTTILDTLGIDLSEKWSFPERAIKEKSSFAGRLGGDEFVIFLRGSVERDNLVTLLQNMLVTLNNVEFGELHGIHASFGVVEITGDEHDIDHVYNLADDALYASKRAGKNQITFSGASPQKEASL